MRIKNEELANGRKLSFHSLWAAEFKKIHPTSHFTSNNLSVHFWTWRKQQQKLQANAEKNQIKMEDSDPDSPPPSAEISPTHSSTNSNLAPKRSHPGGIGTFKDILGREKLMEVGGRVEKMLQDPDTPNETKLKGFAQVLLEEWTKGIF